MYMCMCVCVYIYIYIYIHTHMYMCMCMDVYTHILYSNKYLLAQLATFTKVAKSA